ncbi:hypothetical protein CDD80_4314 [Ophiocordyceps camponoti-rufipedis]|uniref:RRM domain-containing protein n=1 Tax=Ophiocordyceps camponoti-rufipedis TaxID=2004952 RepID=A0A2C5ZMI0_9HYPO|nr:hypothetical protein CDD80_4314 [Ophiocordyceps camponoti-rufipedis]
MRHFKIVAALAAVFAAVEASESFVFKVDRGADVVAFIQKVLADGQARFRQSKDTGLYTAVSFDFDTKEAAEAAKRYGAGYPSYPLDNMVTVPPTKFPRHEKRKVAGWPTGRMLRSEDEDVRRRDLEARGNPMAPSSLAGDFDEDYVSDFDPLTNAHHHTKRHDYTNGFIDLSRVDNDGADRDMRQLVGGQRPALNPDQDERMAILRRDTGKIAPNAVVDETGSIARRASPGRPPSVHSDEPDRVAAV